MRIAPVAARPQRPVGVAVDRRVQHDPALLVGEGGHVRAAAGEADAEWGAGANVHGWSRGSLSVDFPPVSQPEQRDEVRIADYASRIVRRWYVVVACIVVAMLLVTLRTSTGGNRYQSQTSIFVGQPLTPIEGGTIPSTVVRPTRPRAATFVRSQPVIFKAARAAGIKPVALHARTSVVVLAGGSAVKAALANANIQITVLGATTWSRDQVQTAARSLGDQLIVLGEHLPAPEVRAAEDADRAGYAVAGDAAAHDRRRHRRGEGDREVGRYAVREGRRVRAPAGDDLGRRLALRRHLEQPHHLPAVPGRGDHGRVGRLRAGAVGRSR